MSEPKRYQRCYHKDYIPEGMEEHYNGKWVKWEDYASLKAEVERLTYVGDAMAMMVGHIEVTGDAHRMMLEFSKEWEAAKGVQS